MILTTAELNQRDRYKIATGSILPRPIAWVSSQDAHGRLNLAPYSFFTVAATNPLTLLFCPQTPMPGYRKDTLRNIEATGEFVVNLTNRATAVAMNQTATGLPPEVSEFEFAGLTPAPSQTVRVPRVAEAPVAFECRLQQLVPVNADASGGGVVVFGEVQAIYLHDSVYQDSYIKLDELQPIGRLAGNDYAYITDIFTLIRR